MMLRRIWCLFWYLGHDWAEVTEGMMEATGWLHITISARKCARCNHVVIFDLEPIR